MVDVGVSTTHDEMVRKINQELEEFRTQLKKSQEIIQALVSIIIIITIQTHHLSPFPSNPNPSGETRTYVLSPL